MNNFIIGCDPEFMAMKDSKLISAIGILPPKDKCIIKDNNEFYFDNVLAEIAVSPSNSKEEFLKNIKNSLTTLANLMGPSKIIIRAAADYPNDQIIGEDAKIAACNPEWSVYSLTEIFPPDEDVELVDGHYEFKTNFRSAGGHIHIGSEKLCMDSLYLFNIVRMMDLFIALPSIYLDKDETSHLRRRIYGQAGSHRLPEHGLEYRALGNFWFSSPELVSLIYDLTEFVINFVESKNYEKFWSFEEALLDEEDTSEAFKCFGYDIELLIKTINTSDKKEGIKFLNLISNYLPKNLFKQIEKLMERPLSDPYESWSINV